jgi:potassium/hydrogen antiporter
MISIDQTLLGVAVLLLISVVGSKAAGRLGVPALLLFILLGMLAGSDGPGGIYFDDFSLAQHLGVAALALILFSGGLDTSWRRVRPLIRQGLLLSTAGVLLTALLVALFASVALGFSLYEGLLLGAIVSSTDAAAVFSVLRSRNANLRGQLEPLLELESGSNDPMAVFLTVGFTGLLVNSTTSVAELIPMFVQQMALGAALGYGIGRGMVIVVNRLRLEYDGLYPVLTLSLAFLTYGATASLGGNGFLAVYLAGLVMGRYNFIHKNSLMRFHDGLAWLMQIAMFVTLGLLVFPSELPGVALSGLVMALFLIFVARPIGVFLSLPFSGFSFREKTLVSWVGLRGAVPIILATFPLVAGVPRADMIFNLVFFIVITSALLQGTSIPWVARWLGLDAPPARRQARQASLPEDIRSRLVELVVPDGSAAVGKRIMDLGTPEGSLIVLVRRGDEYLVPSGGTALEAGDNMLVFGHEEALNRIRALVRSPRPDKTGKE